jgi:hypothetical protein
VEKTLLLVQHHLQKSGMIISAMMELFGKAARLQTHAAPSTTLHGSIRSYHPQWII